ncbi:hypothetical protein T12_15550 [Trichinella patagoniensis]|uniref:Uncharacterized protein n=1 Tax=Trichinella patagoniensis TaxID=990121 RepID=A0A0V1AG73_9BILA|nr:hypothetical protein T12_15550 [Trichinella patagoniensis]
MITTLRQSSSAGARIDLSSVRFECDMTKISNCGLRHPMKLVPFATRVRMDVKAFPSRPISRWHSQIAFPTVLMFFLVTQVSNCKDESRILNDLHRIERINGLQVGTEVHLISTIQGVTIP